MSKKIIKFTFLAVVVFLIGFFIERYQQLRLFNQNRSQTLFNQNSNYSNNLEKISIEKQEIPLPTGLRRMKYTWEYNQQNFELEDVLYETTYNFYKNQPKVFKYSGELPVNWEDEYYGIFLKTAKNDNSIRDLAVQLNRLAEKNNLNDDQKVELIVAFVQSIPYDSNKAKEITEGMDKIKPSYPYEVLYENLGICSGKSFLLVVLLRELGYGSALFEYEKENHMAVGIKCPLEYSVDNSGYCYAETTSKGHKIGIIPELNLDNNEAIVKTTKEHLVDDKQNSSNLVKPSQVKIFQKIDGKEYKNIKNTVANLKKIDDLEVKIGNLKSNLQKAKQQVDEDNKKLDELNKKLEVYEKDGKNKEYNELVPQYNQLVEQLKKEVGDYNNMVNLYNTTVDEYNTLIKSF